MCKAVLDIPACGPIKGSRWTGLSDEEAMTFGRRAAQTLSEQDGFVIVTLSDGRTVRLSDVFVCRTDNGDGTATETFSDGRIRKVELD